MGTTRYWNIISITLMCSLSSCGTLRYYHFEKKQSKGKDPNDEPISIDFSTINFYDSKASVTVWITKSTRNDVLIEMVRPCLIYDNVKKINTKLGSFTARTVGSKDYGVSVFARTLELIPEEKRNMKNGKFFAINFELTFADKVEIPKSVDNIIMIDSIQYSTGSVTHQFVTKMNHKRHTTLGIKVFPTK